MKKVLSVFLTLILCLTSFNLISVEAASDLISEKNINKSTFEKKISNNMLSFKKENYNFIEGELGDNHVVYTYESNGSRFKVDENANENFSEVNSTIYLEDENGIFSEYATQNLTINNSIFTLTTITNGEVTTEIQDLSLEDSDIPHENNLSNHNDVITYGLAGTCNGYDATGWQFVSPVRYGSTTFSNYTLTAVVASITFIATGTTGGAAGAVAVGIAAIANKVVDQVIPIIYYELWYYEKKLVNPPISLRNFIVGTNHYTKWYLDSGRKVHLETIDSYKYDSCFRP